MSTREEDEKKEMLDWIHNQENSIFYNSVPTIKKDNQIYNKLTANIKLNNIDPFEDHQKTVKNVEFESEPIFLGGVEETPVKKQETRTSQSFSDYYKQKVRATIQKLQVEIEAKRPNYYAGTKWGISTAKINKKVNDPLSIKPHPFAKKSIPEKNVVYKYRLILQNAGAEIKFLKFPEELKDLTNEEIIDKVNKGEISGVQYVNTIPDKNNKEIILDELDLETPIVRLTHEEVSEKDFIEKTAKNFISIDTKTIISLMANRINQSEFNATMKLENPTTGEASCRKAVPFLISSRQSPLYVSNESRWFLSTGKCNIFNNTIELIALNKSSLTTSAYFEKSNFNIINTQLSFVKVYSDNLVLTNFLKVKIKTTEKSTEYFGAKTARRKMIDKEFIGNQFYRQSSYYNVKFDKHIPCICIRPSARSAEVRFLEEDIEYYIIDPNTLPQKKSVKSKKPIYTKDMSVKIIDDRRLTNFKKGDEAILVSLTKNKNNLSNSKIIIKDRKGTLETLFLKQIKPYGNPVKKEEPKKQIIKEHEIIGAKLQISRLKKEQNIASDNYYKPTNTPEEKKRYGDQFSTYQRDIDKFNEIIKVGQNIFIKEGSQTSF